MKTFFKVIGVLIVLGGILWYMQRMILDYNEGVTQTTTTGTVEKAKLDVLTASTLAQDGNTQDAIDLLLKTIEENPKNIEPQLKLAQLYVINCKEHDENCEDALWQLNVILQLDSTNGPAKLMLQELKSKTHPK